MGGCKTDLCGSGDSTQQLTAKPSFVLFLDQLVLFKGRAISSEKKIFWQRLIPVISRILSVQQLS